MKKFKIIFIVLVLFFASCKQKSDLIEKEYYPIDKQENNILINIKKDITPKKDKIYKIYFFMSDFNTRNLDTIFYTILEMDEVGTLDIRLFENKLIATDIRNQNNQSIIDLNFMFPTYFNEETVNDWVISDMNEQAEKFFCSTYEIASRSFFNSFQIENIKTKTVINFSIFILNYKK